MTNDSESGNQSTQKDGFVKDCKTCGKRGVRKYKSGNIDTCLTCRGKGWMNEQDVANHKQWQEQWKLENIYVPELREIEFLEWEYERQSRATVSKKIEWNSIPKDRKELAQLYPKGEPVIYRWACYNEQGNMVEAYVGETTNLGGDTGRFYDYARPYNESQAKNYPSDARKANLVIKASEAGLKVQLEVLAFESITIGNEFVGFEEIRETQLMDKSARNKIERHMIIQAIQEGANVWNKLT